MNCNGCTLCCRMLIVPWLDKPAGVACKYAEPGAGCRLWPTPPDGCKSFECMYRQDPNASERFRPDRCGMLFEKIASDIVLGTIRVKVNLHQSFHPILMSPAARSQISGFRRNGLSVVVSAPGLRRKTVYPAPGESVQSVSARVEAILEGLRDCA